MADMLCTNCGSQGKPARTIKGSILIEIILWLMFIIPGLIYTIWRDTTRSTCCPECKAANMIPLDSPIAKKIMAS